jgi:predicted transcriptional regulator
MFARRRPRGTLEQEVVAALAAADTPLTPGQVRDELGGDLAYTTVMTVLARLHDKGGVVRTRSGRAYAYSLVVDEAEITARQMQRLLDAGDDREAVLSRFVGALSDEDERILVELLRHAEPDDPDGVRQ